MLKLNKTNKDLLSVQHKLKQILCFQIRTERQFLANPAYNYILFYKNAQLPCILQELKICIKTSTT